MCFENMLFIFCHLTVEQLVLIFVKLPVLFRDLSIELVLEYPGLGLGFDHALALWPRS